MVRCSVCRPWVTVTSRDLLTLEDGEFLNDSVVRPARPRGATSHVVLFIFTMFLDPQGTHLASSDQPPLPCIEGHYADDVQPKR